MKHSHHPHALSQHHASLSSCYSQPDDATECGTTMLRSFRSPERLLAAQCQDPAIMQRERFWRVRRLRTKTAGESGDRPFYGRYSHVKLKAHQANERSLVVWVCAGLLIMMCSIPAAQFNREIDASPIVEAFLTIKPYQTSSLLGLASLILGVVVGVLACFRYVRTRKNIEEGIYRGPDFLHLAFLAAILFALLFIGLYLMERRGARWASRIDSSTSRHLGAIRSQPGAPLDNRTDCRAYPSSWYSSTLGIAPPGLNIRSTSSRLTMISRGFAPFSGPTIPRSSIISTMRAARV